MNYSWTFLALSIGCMIPFQGIITSNLARRLEHPFASAFINFLVGAVIFAIAIFFSSAELPSLKKLASIPWYLFTGGLVGSFFILGAVFALPKIGSSAFFGMIVLGQLVMTIIVDHYGFFDLPIHKADGLRIVGLALLVSGAFLILKK